MVERPANSDVDADTNVDEDDVESGANRAFDAGDEEGADDDDAGVDDEPGVDSRRLDDPGAAADDADDDDSGKGFYMTGILDPQVDLTGLIRYSR